MTNNPFNRNTTKEAKLGTIISSIGDQNQRDAIHIAVVPIKAHDVLKPGQHIGVSDDGTISKSSNPVGIVDPFLMSSIQKDEIFWLFLYQGSVNSLRHEWTHPAFPTVTTVVNSKTEKDMSIVWLKAYAMKYNHYLETSTEAYNKLMQDIEDKLIVYQGTDMHSRGELHDEDELRYHAEIVLGRKLNFDEFEFSCSC